MYFQHMKYSCQQRIKNFHPVHNLSFHSLSLTTVNFCSVYIHFCLPKVFYRVDLALNWSTSKFKFWARHCGFFTAAHFLPVAKYCSSEKLTVWHTFDTMVIDDHYYFQVFKSTNLFQPRRRYSLYLRGASKC